MPTKKTRMPDAFSGILGLAFDSLAISVCLGAAFRDEPVPRYERLQMTEELTDEFRVVVQDKATRLAKDFMEAELVLRPYDPGTKPDSHEIEHLDLATTPSVKDQIAPLGPLASLPLFDPRGDVAKNLRFYVIVVQDAESAPAYFFRSYTSKRELGRSSWFAALFSDGQFDEVREPLFLFDHQLDCFSQGDDLFILSKDGFQKVFRFFELLKRLAQQTLETVRALVPIANFDEFAASSQGHLQKLAKLKNIAGKDYLKRVTMEDIKKVIAKNSLPVEVVVKNGVEMLVFDPSDRWAILRLLDDDYLESLMTGLDYEVTSKRVMG